MRLREIAAVIRSEWSAYSQSQFLLRLTGSHLGVTLVVLLSTWPSRIRLASPEQALTWNWFVYLQLGALTYVALAVAADLFPIKGRIAPYEWVYYDVAHPLSVLVGRLIAIAALIALMFILVVPIGMAAHSVYAVPGTHARGIVIVVATVCLCLIAAGSYFSTGSTERLLRSASALALYVASLAVFVALGGWIGPWNSDPRPAPLNPLGALYYFLAPPADPGSRLAATARDFPWTSWTALYACVFLFFSAGAYARLLEWQKTANARPGGRPASEGRRLPPQKDAGE